MAPHPSEAVRSQQLRNWALLRRRGREGRICAHIWEPAVSKALPAVQVEGPTPQSPNWLPSRQTLPRNHRRLERIFPKCGAFHSLGVCLRRMGHTSSLTIGHRAGQGRRKMKAQGRATGILTAVVAFGLAPCWSRTLMMCVWPCWAAWCRGV